MLALSISVSLLNLYIPFLDLHSVLRVSGWLDAANQLLYTSPSSLENTRSKLNLPELPSLFPKQPCSYCPTS